VTAKTPIWRAPRVSYCAQGRIWVRMDCLECQTVNLSESGLLLVCPMPCPPGAPVRIDLPLPGFARPMPLPSLVVRETQFDGEYALAVKFETLLPGSLAVLRTFLQRELTAEVPLTAKVPLPDEELEAPEPQPEPPLELQPIDLAELDLPGPAPAASPMSDAPLDLANPSNLSRPSPSPRPMSPKKREVARRLRAMVAARRTEEMSPVTAPPATAAVAPSAPPVAKAPPPVPGRSPPAADDFDDVSVQEDVPEFSAKEIYLEEERELIEELPSDHKLRRLYHDAVAEVDDNEQKLQGTFKKRKGWF